MKMRDNPYATPQAAGPAEEAPARVTMRGRWFFIVVFSVSVAYQLMIGVSGVRDGYFPDAAERARYADPDHPYWIANRFVMPLFLGTGVMTLNVIWNLLRRRWSRWVFWTGLLAAFLTWIPFLILNVVPVMLWISRRPGRFGAVPVSSAKSVETMPVDEAIRILREEARLRFEIREEQFGVSLVGRLRIAPGEVNGFLYDLEADHGVSLVDEVDESTASVQDMIDVLARRKMDALV
jgi:hypothetical protein